MAYCVKCGARVEDQVRFCPYCGEEIPKLGKYAEQTENGARYTYNQTCEDEQAYGQGHPYSGERAYGQGHPYSGEQSYDYKEKEASKSQEGFFDASEVKRNKGMAVLSYLGILVVIPLLAGDKRSPYVKHHVNQGLILFILSSLLDLLDGKWVWGFHSWIDFGGNMFSRMIDLVSLGCFVLFVMGLISACKGTRQELPLIGKIRIVK